MIERDAAILRLIYTFEVVWKACRLLLAERENIEVASPNTTIRTAPRLGWLTDEEAQAIMQIGRDRNLSADMYRGEIGESKRASRPMPLFFGAGSTPWGTWPGVPMRA